MPIRNASVLGTEIKLVFDYDLSLIKAIKTIPGYRYCSQPKNRHWTIPLSATNVDKIVAWGFNPIALKKERKIDTATIRKKLDELLLKLRSYQQKDVEKIVGLWNTRALIGSEVGTGKTAVALASIYCTPDSGPILVICPSSLKYNWRKEALMWFPENAYKIKVLEGYPTSGRYIPQPDEITIINYDVIANRSSGKLGWASIFANYKTLVLDECHKIKNLKSARTQAIMKIRKMFDYVLCLSGTPIESKPLEFFPVLHLLKNDLFPSFWKYVNRYCAAKMGLWGWDFNGASNISELYNILVSNLMVRHLKSEILEELPSLQRIVVHVQIDMKTYFSQMKELVALYNDKNNRFSALVLIEKLRQVVIDCKMPFVFDWIDNYLENSNKLIVFCIHKKTIEALKKKYKEECVVVDGTVTGEKRQQAVDAFQNPAGPKLFVGNIKAAGEGITLTQAHDCLFIELDWAASSHQQAENRHHRIGQTADRVCAYYLVAEGTIEDIIMNIIDHKATQFAEIVDGETINPMMLLKHLCNIAEGDCLNEYC